MDGEIWRLDPGATTAVRVTQGLRAAGPPSPSPDGGWLAVPIDGAEPGVAIVSVAGGWARILDGTVAVAAWQPASAGT